MISINDFSLLHSIYLLHSICVKEVQRPVRDWLQCSDLTWRGKTEEWFYWYVEGVGEGLVSKLSILTMGSPEFQGSRETGGKRAGRWWNPSRETECGAEWQKMKETIHFLGTESHDLITQSPLWPQNAEAAIT